MVNRYGCGVVFFFPLPFYFYNVSKISHNYRSTDPKKKRITKTKSKMLTFGWPDFIENGLGSNDQVNG